jgi:hypothetical protein
MLMVWPYYLSGLISVSGGISYFSLKILLIISPGFSYLALSTAAAFMQHLILYFWNHFEVMIIVYAKFFFFFYLSIHLCIGS